MTLQLKGSLSQLSQEKEIPKGRTFPLAAQSACSLGILSIARLVT